MNKSTQPNNQNDSDNDSSDDEESEDDEDTGQEDDNSRTSMPGLLGRNDDRDDEESDEEDEERSNKNTSDESSSSGSSSSSGLPTPSSTNTTQSKTQPKGTIRTAAPMPTPKHKEELSQSPIQPRQLDPLKKPPYKIDEANLQAKVNQIRRYKRQSRRFLDSERKKLHAEINRSSTDDDNTVDTDTSSSKSSTSDSNYEEERATTIDNAQGMKTLFQHWSPDTIGPRSRPKTEASLRNNTERQPTQSSEPTPNSTMPSNSKPAKRAHKHDINEPKRKTSRKG